MRIAIWVLLSCCARGVAAAEPTVPTVESLRQATTQLLADWTKAQHAGDSKAYLSYYDSAHFKGTKRTVSGDRKVYDFAAWATDRTRMLKNNPEVAVEGVQIQTWLDGGKRGHHMKSGLVHVRFLQRWRSPRYADHGPKIMQLFYGSDGKLRIIYEALLQSRPGWDQASVAAQAMTTPRSDEEAALLWQKLGLTGKNWEEKLAAIPDDERLRRALARTALSGDLNCQNLVDEGSCGEEDWRWGPIPDSATFDNPCLRQKVAIWALRELEPSDVRKLSEPLLKVFHFKRTKHDVSRMPMVGKGEGEELCEAVLDAAAAVPELQAKAIAAAIDEHCAEDSAVAAVPKLSEKARAGLAEDGVEAAFADLPAKKYAQLFLTAAKSGGSVAHRVTVMRALASAGLSPSLTQELKTALRAIADDLSQPDEVGATAGVLLANLGDPSRLPGRPATGDVATFETQLRRLSYDPDKERGKARLRLFMPPGKKGSLKFLDQTETEYDGNTAPEDRQEHVENTTRVPYDQLDWTELEYFLRPVDGHETKLNWKTIGGKLYLVGYETTEHRFVGCGC